jgi:hypothetical protein
MEISLIATSAFECPNGSQLHQIPRAMCGKLHPAVAQTGNSEKSNGDIDGFIAVQVDFR